MKNPYRVEGDLAYIEVQSKNRPPLEAVIDLDDLPRVMAFPNKWMVHSGSLRVGHSDRGSAGMTVQLARLIRPECPTRMIRFADGNPLNCRRDNIKATSEMDHIEKGETFDQFWAREGEGWARSALRRYLDPRRRPDDFHDITMDVWLRLREHWPRARPDALGAWVWMAVRNAYFDHYRRLRRFIPVTGVVVSDEDGDDIQVDSYLEDPDVGAETLVEWDEAIRAAGGGSHFPLIYLHHALGYPLGEIAAATGLTVPALKSRLARGRALARRRLADLGLSG